MDVAQEARELRSRGADAIEESVHAAKRAVKVARQSVEELGEMRDETARYIKREPFKAVGLAMGAGILFGLAASLIGRAAVRAR